jgi:hypothetical protein
VPSRHPVERLVVLARLGLIGLLALALAACGLVSTSAPPVGPDDFAGISRRLASRGVTIQQVVSGDSGCDDAELARTAIRFESAGLDQAEPATIHLYIFRNRAAFERNRPEVARCALSYVTDPAATRPIEVSPYVLVTPATLEPGFAAAVRGALEEAAGTGG